MQKKRACWFEICKRKIRNNTNQPSAAKKRKYFFNTLAI